MDAPPKTKDDCPKFSLLEPDWSTCYLGSYPQEKVLLTKGVYQQSDLLKPMLNDIVNFGLNHTYLKYKGADLPITGQVSVMRMEPLEYTKTSNKKHVIIVGAGLAGLSAAYELTKVGHEVDILEMQNRVGGRVKTLREKDGFSKHCHAEAGAMRLPNKWDDKVKTHYLTDFYAKEFDLTLGPFNNSDDNAWLKFYDQKKIKISDWKNNSTKYCNQFWKGWDERFHGNEAVQIKDIDDYYDQTTEIVTDQLKKKLDSIGDGPDKEKKMAKVWDDWINNWSKFSLIVFLQNTKDAVLQLLDKDHQLDANAAKKLDALIPWPDAAIRAYSVYSYTEQLDQSLVQYLRDQLGNWWSPNMHRIVEGTYKLPQAFTKKRDSPWPSDDTKIHLKEKVTFHIKVDEIVYAAEDHDDFQSQRVTVKGKYVSSGEPFQIEGDAVIVTVPLHILRQIRFVAAANTEPAKKLTEIYRSLGDIWQGPATKIMLQYSKRFWEEGDIHERIHGGFSKTTMPIGQLHYPTFDPNAKTKRGILLCYTWKSEALMFAAMKPHDAIREAVNQIAQIHPGSEKHFEVGAVQAWTNEPSAQGAYALPKPRQYVNIRNLMITPCLNMFFAGDGISFVAGWMQGALESGLRAAYQFYCRNEESAKKKI